MSVKKIGLEVTNRCNYRCTHCLRADIAPRKDLPQEYLDVAGKPNPRLDIPIELVEKIIREARAYEMNLVSFTGGEPTLHPQFGEILKMFHDAAYEVTFITNGTRFNKVYRNIEPYLDCVRAVHFSLDGATEETCDYIRERGAFRRVMEAVTICKVKNIPFALQMVITRDNQHEIEAMAALGSRLGAREVLYIPVQPTLQTTHKDMDIHPDEWNGIREELGRMDQVYTTKVVPCFGFPHQSYLVSCETLFMNTFFVDYLGNLTFCCQLSGYTDSNIRTDIIANLNETSLLEAHRGYIQMVREYQEEKLRRFQNGELNELDKHACWYCFKYFKKADWIKQFPQSPWHGDDIRSKHIPEHFLQGREVIDMNFDLPTGPGTIDDNGKKEAEVAA